MRTVTFLFLLLLISRISFSQSCEFDRCNEPIPLACNQPYFASTVNSCSGYSAAAYSDCHSTDSDYSGGDRLHSFIGTGGPVTITLTGLSADLDIFVFDSELCSTGSANCLTKSTNSNDANEFISMSTAIESRYYIVVDGHAQGVESDYTLTVNCGCDCPAIYEPVCAGGVTYPNACVARCEGVTEWTPGECPLSCEGEPGNGCENWRTIECGQTVNGRTIGHCNNFDRGLYTFCQETDSDYNAPDQLYAFTATGSIVEISLSGFERNLDIFLFSNSPCSDVPNCIGRGVSSTISTETIRAEVTAGQRYFILIDGPNLEQQSHYTLTVECVCSCPAIYDPVCAGGVTYPNACVARCEGVTEWTPGECPLSCEGEPGNGCENWRTIECGQTVNGRTIGHCNNFDRSLYTFCQETDSDYNAPDQLYAFTAAGSIVEISLSGFERNLDIFLFSNSPCSDVPNCIGRGVSSTTSTETIRAEVTAGQRYFILIDGPNLEQQSHYTLTVECVCSCPAIYDPVCAGGVTYPNACVARCEGVTEWTPGECTGDCEPTCTDIINFRFDERTSRYQFSIPSGYEEVSWEVKETGESLGSGNVVHYDLPSDECIKRTIQVTYREGDHIRVCCRTICLCNPFTCNLIRFEYSQTGEQLILALEGDYERILWRFADAEGEAVIGDGKRVTYEIPASTDCYQRLICVRFYDIVKNCWRICYRRIFICHPYHCDLIHYEYNGEGGYDLSLDEPDADPSTIQWYNDETGMQAGTGTRLTVPINGACRQVNYCVRYYDRGCGCWRVCCVSFLLCEPGGPPGFIIADGVCGVPGQIVEVPVRVKNFTDITSLNMSLVIDDPAVAEFLEIIPGPSLPPVFDHNIVSSSSAVALWFSSSGNPVSLPDDAVIFTIIARLTGQSGSSTGISFTDTPVPVFVTQDQEGSSVPIIPVLTDGSVCVDTNIDIGGRIYREDGAGVANVTVTLAGAVTMTTATDQSGHYLFTGVPAGGDYTVEPEKNTGWTNGVFANDLFEIQRHILLIQPLPSPYTMISADANNSGGIFSDDLVELQRLILLKIPAIAGNESWRFVPVDHSFPDPANPFAPPFPEQIAYTNLSVDVNDADFYACKTGDVDLNANTSTLTSQPVIRAPDLELRVEDRELPAGASVIIPVKAGKLEDLAAYQFTLEFDREKLRLEEVIPGQLDGLDANNFGLESVSDGAITALWYNKTGAGSTLSPDQALFHLRFQVLQDAPSLLGMIRVSSARTKARSFVEGAPPAGVDLSVVKPSAPAERLFRHTVVPNPFTGNARLILEIGAEQAGKVIIYDQLGRIIKTYDRQFTAGENEVLLELQDRPAQQGVLFYKIQLRSQSAVGRMIRIRE
jgi:hypothetical protein